MQLYDDIRDALSSLQGSTSSFLIKVADESRDLESGWWDVSLSEKKVMKDKAFWYSIIIS